MALLDEIASAFGELQALFGYTAIINGSVINVTKGPSVRLGEEYGDGGINATQAVSLFYLTVNNPAPHVADTVVFQGVTYRVESIQQHYATWEISCVQVTA